MSWNTARTCPAVSWCRNMSMSRTPLSRRRRPAWSMRFSIRSRVSSVPVNSRGPVAEMTVPGAPASSEDSLIARYFRPLATDPGAFGLSDDAAVLKALGQDIIVTTDAIVEGVHFLSDDPPQTIAKKALRVNLSDLAAKGATPAGFALTLALRQVDENWLAAFARGVGVRKSAITCAPLARGTA